MKMIFREERIGLTLWGELDKVLPRLLDRISSVLRLGTSVDIREYENAAVWDYTKNTSLASILFGIGLGGTAGSYGEMSVALNKQFDLGMWNRNYNLTKSGALFHNLYANIWVCMGVIGILMLIWINTVIWKRISKSCGERVLVRRCLHFFQISFLWMNYYRWSAVCGISEMIILALILKSVENINEQKSDEDIANKNDLPRMQSGMYAGAIQEERIE